MGSSNSSEIFLWFIAALVATTMVAVLVLGWMKGNVWQKEHKVKRR